MREIKFRAWDGSTMFPVNVLALAPVYWTCGDGRGVSLEYQPHIQVMQYTGLKDKNGLEICEGDIVRYCDFEYEEENLNDWTISEIVWCGEHDYPAFDLKHHDYESNGLSHIKGYGMVIEVIGNIYENPEILI